MPRRNSPTVNSGSMADIAFLLLIFFLLTTTISAEKGIKRTLPNDCPPNSKCNQTIEDQNLLRLVVNSNSEIMINNEEITLDDLASKIISFVDNNSSKTCDYCEGEQLNNSSEAPNRAFISLNVHPQTPYDFYVSVQDEISKAYFHLRSNYIKYKFNKEPFNLTKQELAKARKAYPFNLVENHITP